MNFFSRLKPVRLSEETAIAYVAALNHLSFINLTQPDRPDLPDLMSVFQFLCSLPVFPSNDHETQRLILGHVLKAIQVGLYDGIGWGGLHVLSVQYIAQELEAEYNLLSLNVERAHSMTHFWQN